MKTRAVGKLVLAIILGYAGLMLASLAGGGLAGVLGVILHLSAETIASLEWIFPKVIFLGTLVGLYIWQRRKKMSRRTSSTSAI